MERSYNAPSPPDPVELIEHYVAFNPHGTFAVHDHDNPEMTFEATHAAWRKWKPDAPTSAHWYTTETLRDLIAAYVACQRTINGSSRCGSLCPSFEDYRARPNRKQSQPGYRAGVHKVCQRTCRQRLKTASCATQMRSERSPTRLRDTGSRDRVSIAAMHFSARSWPDSVCLYSRAG